MKPSSSILRFFIFGSFLCSPAFLVAQGKALPVSSSKNEIVLDYYPLHYTPQAVSIGSHAYLYFPESELTSKTGEPGLPTESFLLGIPPSGRVDIEMVDEQISEHWAGRVAPIPMISIGTDSLHHMERTFFEGSSASLEAPKAVRIDGIFWWRYQRVARISVRPVSFDPPNGSLQLRRRMHLRISFSGPQVGSFAPRETQRTEELYKEILVNYEQARQWRSVEGMHIQSTADSTGSWFASGQEFVKIHVEQEGIYRLTFDDLQAAGAVPLSLSLQNADLFYRGKSIPFRLTGDTAGSFGAGDTIEFYGSRFFDSPRVLNEYSDTSVYWLTFSGSGANRTVVDTNSAVTPQDTAKYFVQTYRMEKDSFYFYGNGGLPTNNQPAKVFGEGWYWKRLLSGESAFIDLTTDHFDTTGSPVYTVRGHLHSPVTDQASSPDHSIDIRVNNTLVGTIQFEGNRDTIFALQAPSNLLVDGNNVFTLKSNATGASLNEVFVDWLELDCRKKLVADSDTLEFSADHMTANEIALFQIAGFTSPDIEVYRIDQSGGIERVFRGAVSGSLPYSISFVDTVKIGKKYLALTKVKKRPPAIIQKKVFGNLRSTVQGADYLVITSRELFLAANQLASHRSAGGIGRTAVVEVEDIYDEFNYGLFNPFALRSFLLAADTLWTAPKPSMVVLFGDATWDYRNFLKTSRRNQVPSLGNPVSDEWLVASPADVFLPEKEVGRIPATSVTQGLDFISALVQYESQPLSAWNKTFMFMVSGFDSAETATFSQFSESMISQNITPAPIAGLASRLYRKVQVSGSAESEEVRKILSDGAVWINFYGHAATEAWGNGLSEPADLINSEGKRHLVTDVSCSTVRFAEPLVESFAEKVLFATGGGAIAYIGGSGFGYENPLRYMASSFYNDVAQDTIREIGNILLRAKIALHAVSAGSMTDREALQLLTLLGDPATRVAIATKPDYHVESNEISVDPAQPSEADDKVTLRIPLRNFGLKGTDSVKTRITHTVENDLAEFIDVVRPSIGFVDTAVVSKSSFLKAGFHNVSVTIDPDGSVAEENEANNTATAKFFVGAGQLQILVPADFSSLDPDSVVLTVINPNNPQTVAWKVVFEIDTSTSFVSPALVRHELPQPGIVTSSWQIPAGALADSTVYFWRARLKGPADSTEWRERVFSTSKLLKTEWVQDRAGLFAMDSIDQVTVSLQPHLRQRQAPAEVYSAGFSDGNEARITLDGVNISQGFSNRGYNIAVVDQHSGELESYAAFSIYSDITDTTLAAPLVQYLQSIPYGKKVLVAVADEGSRNKSEQLNLELESIGSSQIRSLGFRGSWAISGWKGAPIGSVPELLSSSGAGPVTVYDTLAAKSIKGTILSPVIGPASAWNDAAFLVDTASGITHITTDIIRTMRDGSRDTVTAASVARDSLMAFLTPSVATIQLRARLESDSAGLSPILKKWSVDFTPVAELVLSYQTTTIPNDSVDEGDLLTVQANVHNVGFSSADSVNLSVGVFVNNQISVFSQRTIPSIPASSSVSESIPFNTAGYRGRVAFLVQVNADSKVLEASRANDAMSLNAFVVRDTLAPAFDVTFDGARILDGDYVNPSPEIRISVRDNSPLAITNPANVDLRLDQRRINLGSNPDSLFQTGTGNEKASVIFRPVISNGSHTLSVQVLDASGNPADTAAMEMRFQVENRARLMNVVNIPNPFATETAFTFQLSGPVQPEEGKLRIYAVSGRMLYERVLYPGEVRLGFNRVVWNGRDRDGDEIANGVYFYKISVKTGEENVEAIEKLAKLR